MRHKIAKENSMEIVSEEEAATIDELRLMPKMGEDFNTNWNRATQKRYELVADQGLAGVRLCLLADDVTFDFIGRAGETQSDLGCPWSFPAGITPCDVVEQVFEPLRDRLPIVVELLSSHCLHVITLKQGKRWRLLYVLPHTEYSGRISWQFIGGGQPLKNPRLPKAARDLGWRMPKDLREFYAVHNGFGRHFYDNPFGWSQILVPQNQLTLLSEFIDSKANGAKYDSGDLLEFYPDGAGNGQYFYRRNPKDNDPPTYDWDHETWGLSGPTDFYEFLDERLVELKEE
jgi:hypothetical protein